MKNGQGMATDRGSRTVTKLQEIALPRIAEMQAFSPTFSGVWVIIGTKVGAEMAIRRVLMSLQGVESSTTVPLMELAYLLGQYIAEKNNETLRAEVREAKAGATEPHCDVGVKVLQFLLDSLVLFVIKTDATGSHVVSLHPEWALRLPQFGALAA